MLRPDRIYAVPYFRPAPNLQGLQGSARRTRRIILSVLATSVWVAAATSGFAWGGKVHLVRKYHRGQKMIYQTEIHSKSVIHSEPPSLKNFFPPVPLEFLMRQQNTVTVKAIRPDGGADIQHRFDKFEVQSDLSSEMPDELQDSTRQAQQEIGQRLTGQTLTAHYSRNGHLLGFDGADALLEEFDEPLREPIRQMLQVFLEQMGAQALYPDHQVKPGEQWKEAMNTAPRKDYPFDVKGESTLRYVGKAKYRGVKAAILDFRFDNVLTPALDNLRREGPMAQLEANGMGLDIRIQGHGEGRVLVALDDGRILQNHTTMHQTMVALLKGRAGLELPTDQPVKLEIQSQTEMNVEGTGR